MTREDKQSVISICRILADKMDDSGKVAVEQVISAVESIEEQEPKTGWIPVSERLPEDKTYVLTTIKIHNRVAHARSGWYQNGFFLNDNGDAWKATDIEVKAWIPLPAPFDPQESEEQT